MPCRYRRQQDALTPHFDGSECRPELCECRIQLFVDPHCELAGTASVVLGASEHDASAARQRCNDVVLAKDVCVATSRSHLSFQVISILSASNMYHEVLSVISPCCILFSAKLS